MKQRQTSCNIYFIQKKKKKKTLLTSQPFYDGAHGASATKRQLKRSYYLQDPLYIFLLTIYVTFTLQ